MDLPSRNLSDQILRAGKVNNDWLVVGYPPLWKIWVRQLGWWNSQHFWENYKLMATKPPTSLRLFSCNLSIRLKLKPPLSLEISRPCWIASRSGPFRTRVPLWSFWSKKTCGKPSLLGDVFGETVAVFLKIGAFELGKWGLGNIPVENGWSLGLALF